MVVNDTWVMVVVTMMFAKVLGMKVGLLTGLLDGSEDGWLG